MLLELSAAVPRRRAGFVTVLVALVVLAPVIAAADVPDPTWIGGFYDGAGGDELGAPVWDQSPALPFDIVTLAPPSPAPALPPHQDSSPPRERSPPPPPPAPPPASRPPEVGAPTHQS